MNPKFHTMKVIQMRWFAFNLKTVWWMPFKVTRTLPYAIMHTWTHASVWQIETRTGVFGIPQRGTTIPPRERAGESLRVPTGFVNRCLRGFSNQNVADVDREDTGKLNALWIDHPVPIQFRIQKTAQRSLEWPWAWMMMMSTTWWWLKITWPFLAWLSR